MNAVVPASAPGLVVLEHELALESSTWVALPEFGHQRGQTPVANAHELRDDLTPLDRAENVRLLEETDCVRIEDGVPHPSAAHAAPIYLEVRGGDDALAREKAAAVARNWLGPHQEGERHRRGVDEVRAGATCPRALGHGARRGCHERTVCRRAAWTY